MDVLEGSPAESAGLVPYGDWIIGWSGGALSAENDFYDLVEAVWQLLDKLSILQHKLTVAFSTLTSLSGSMSILTTSTHSEKWFWYQIGNGEVRAC